MANSIATELLDSLRGSRSPRQFQVHCDCRARLRKGFPLAPLGRVGGWAKLDMPCNQAQAAGAPPVTNLPSAMHPWATTVRPGLAGRSTGSRTQPSLDGPVASDSRSQSALGVMRPRRENRRLSHSKSTVLTRPQSGLTRRTSARATTPQYRLSKLCAASAGHAPRP